MWRVAVFVGVLASVYGQTTSVQQCVDGQGEYPINTYVDGCATPPCQLAQLQDAVITIIFRAPHVVHSMRTLASARVSFLPIPIDYPLGEHALTCNYLLNSYCPLIAEEVVVYRLRFYIEAFFPAGTAATVEFKIVDHNSDPLACVQLDILITPATRTNSTLLP